ncbi:MAG: T9SS type A sorting domain-containing protein [bacterium]|nr:T9SS type A sorting domain-containing protein [bacterium]
MFKSVLCLLLSLPVVMIASQDGLSGEIPEGLSLIERQLVEGSRIGPAKGAAAEDWAISETISPSRFDQRNPSLSRFPNGNWLIVWDDTRSGAKKIYGRKYDAFGLPLQDDRLLVGSTVGSNYMRPLAAIDSSGLVHLFYRNATTGLILGMVFDSNLTAIVAEFLINDTSLQSFAGDFDADIYPNGQAVVAWENYSSLSTTIEMSIIDSIGGTVLSPTTANSAGGGFSRFDPAVAIDPGGDYLIAWDDRRNAQPDIFVRLFNGGGTAYGADENLLPLPNSSFDQYEPEAVYSSHGEFVIGWSDSRGSGQIFAKRYSRALGQIGSELLISDSLLTADNGAATISANADSSYWLAWTSSTPAPHIQMIRLDSTLSPLGVSMAVDSLPINQKFEPVVKVADSAVLVSWELVASSNADIVARLFDSSGLPLMTGEITVNSDTAGAASVAPSIAAVQESITSRALIAFADERNGSFDVWLQAIDKSGSTTSGNVLLSQDISGTLQAEPDIAIAADTALVVWLDSRVVNLIPGLRLYGRYLDKVGTPLGSEFLISDSNLASLFGQPKVTLNNQTRALAAWVDQRIGTDSLRVYGRWVEQNGLFPSSEFELSGSADTGCTNLSLSVDSAGNFYAIWLNKGKDTADVTIQWYSGGGFLADSYHWRPANDSLGLEQVSATVSDDGQIALLWVGQSSDRQLYLTVLDTTGTIIVPDQQVTSSPNAAPTDPVVSYSESGYLLTGWIDRREGVRKMYHQLYDNSYTPVDPNTAVSSEPVETMEQPALMAVGGRAWFGWVDPRTDGQNVYANSYVFLPTSVDREEPDVLPNQISLSQNYPNPFNPVTRISFSLTRKALVTINVYNLLGQQVRRLVDREYSAGEHITLWDGKSDSGGEVASGLYLYRLRVGDRTESKKMLLLK